MDPDLKLWRDAKRVFDRLVHVPRWQTRRLTEAAQMVQRSGFPYAYQQWESMARALTHALDDDGDLPLRCH